MRVNIKIVSLIIHAIIIVEKIVQNNGLAVWDGEDWVIYQIMAFIVVIYQTIAFIVVLCIGLKARWELRKVGGWRTCVMFKR